MKSGHSILAVAVAATFVAGPRSASAQADPKDIVTTAVEAGSFTTLAAALEAAGLVEVLQGELADKAALTRVLTYHVVAGRVTSDAVVESTEAETVAGIEAPIRVEGGRVWVGGAQVVTPDVHASNGVIHVIDAVMLPPEQ
jgi:uncharacterized surface protein with fasciclin (FAS1) repeats